MSVVYGLQRVLDRGLDDYDAPSYWDIAGVKVWYKESNDTHYKRKWKSMLEDWLPKFEAVGWTEGLGTILIGVDVVGGDGLGMYDHHGGIRLERDIEVYTGTGFAVGTSKTEILTHEMAHHAHLSPGDLTDGWKEPSQKYRLQKDVSMYSGTNKKEAIAEIATGIVHGVDFPEWVHDYYEEHDGPMEVYDIG